MYLMLRDLEVLYFDLSDFNVVEIRPELVPYALRGQFKYETKSNIFKNTELLRDYLSNRVLSLNRDNFKQMSALFQIPQNLSTEDRVNICINSMGVSVTDSYWLRKDSLDKDFNKVNIRKNRFKEIVDISLYGESPTSTTSPINPELTTHGLFRKAWIRDDGDLYLLKSDRFPDNINTRMEVLSSEILSCFSGDLSYVTYTGENQKTKDGDLYVDKCKCFIKEGYSFVEALDVCTYCNSLNISFKEMFDSFQMSSSIGVIDYILTNTDRHMQNYGFFMNESTGELEELVPLFDFNLALVSDVWGKDPLDTLSQMFNDGSSIESVAMLYKDKANLSLNLALFEAVKDKYPEFTNVFDNVLKRCQKMGVELH